MPEDEGTSKTKFALPWTEKDDAALRAGLAEGRLTAELAGELGRTIDAVRGWAQAIGLPHAPVAIPPARF